MKEKQIKVILKEPFKEAEIKTIDNTYEYKRGFIGGTLGAIEFPKCDNADIFYDDDGLGREGNFFLPHYEDCVKGPCIITGYDVDTGECKSLTDKQVKFCIKYIETFEIPKGLDLYADFHLINSIMNKKMKEFDSDTEM